MNHNKTDLNRHWLFRKIPGKDIREISPADPDIRREPAETVTLPHTWYRDGDAYEGLTLYEKTFPVSFSGDQRVFLHFDAADRWAEYYVNGHFAGAHQGGYSAFASDITEWTRSGQENHLMVFVDNRSFDVISPVFGDFTVYGGLYRGVSLTVTENCCFDRSWHGTDGLIIRTATDADGSGIIHTTAYLLGTDGKHVEICYTVLDHDNHPAASLCVPGEAETLTDIRVGHPRFWNGKSSPILYTLRAELRVNGHVTDSLTIPFGFRTAFIHPERGFFLNGTHLPLHGIARHQDFSGCFCATDRDRQEKDMALILETGANAVRLSHYQHPQHTYDLCDKNGLIVWAEIPMLKLTGSEALFENACCQLRELILQNLHHPSICFWGIQNEIAMFRDEADMHDKVRKLCDLAVHLDPGRITACANLHGVAFDSPMNHLTDMVGYNLYFGWYYGDIKDVGTYLDRFHREQPGVALGISEYGADCNTSFHSETPVVKDYSEEFQALYHETFYPEIEKREWLWGSFVWNLADFGSRIRKEGGVPFRNTKGLVSFDRTVRKDAFYYYKARWSEEKFVHITGKRFQNRIAETVSVKVYSNEDKISLSVNGGPALTKTAQAPGVFLFEKIVLQMGENRITASAEDKITDEAIFHRREEADPSYVCEDGGAGSSVTNWFLQEQETDDSCYSLSDPVGLFLRSEEAMALLEKTVPGIAQRIRQDGGGIITLLQAISYQRDQYRELSPEWLNRELNRIPKQP